jgi:endonuclease-3
MRPADRVERLRRIGRLALETGGDLASALRGAGPAKARTLLKRFPSVGDPGADKILLFCGIETRPALESNGVRAMVRLGHAGAGASYAQAYRSAVSALRSLGPPDRDRLVEAFHVLRAHGQTLCKRTTPLCLACPLDPTCAHTPTKGL